MKKMAEAEITILKEKLHDRLSHYRERLSENADKSLDLPTLIYFLKHLTHSIKISKLTLSYEEMQTYWPEGYKRAVRELETKVNPKLHQLVPKIKKAFQDKLEQYRNIDSANIEGMQAALQDLITPIKVDELKIIYKECLPSKNFFYVGVLPKEYIPLIDKLKQKIPLAIEERNRKAEEIAMRAADDFHIIKKEALPLFQARLDSYASSLTVAQYKKALETLESPIKIGDKEITLEVAAKELPLKEAYSRFIGQLKTNIKILDKQEPELQAILDELSVKLSIDEKKHPEAHKEAQRLMSALKQAKDEYIKAPSPEAKNEFIGTCKSAFEAAKKPLQSVMGWDSLSNILKRLINAVRGAFGYGVFFKAEPVKASEVAEKRILLACSS